MYPEDGPTLDETMAEIVEAKEQEDLIDSRQLRRRIEKALKELGPSRSFDLIRSGKRAAYGHVLEMIVDLRR